MPTIKSHQKDQIWLSNIEAVIIAAQNNNFDLLGFSANFHIFGPQGKEWLLAEFEDSHGRHINICIDPSSKHDKLPYVTSLSDFAGARKEAGFNQYAEFIVNCGIVFEIINDLYCKSRSK